MTDRRLYVQIEHHGAPKAARLTTAAHGDNAVVTIRRAGAPDIRLAGNRRTLAGTLVSAARRLNSVTEE